MRKIFVLLIWFLLGLTPFSAMAIKGIYSCSEGNWNGKPVTYVFNETLMVRNDDKSSPFELLGETEDGTRLYFGKVFDPKEDAALTKLYIPDINIQDDSFSIDNSLYKYVSFAFLNQLEQIQNVDDYILHSALVCSLGRQQIFPIDENEKLLFSLVQDKTEAKSINAKNCSWKKDYVANRGIKNIKSYFIQRIKVKRTKLATKNTIISIKPGEEFLFEAPLTGVLTSMQGYNPPKRFNCSVLNIQTPEIEKPKEAFKKAKVI